MYARSTTIQADQDKIEQGIAYVRDEVQPAVTSMDGCVGLSLLVERQTGRCIVTTSWESAEALAASAAGVRPVRERGAEIMGGEPTVDEWEVAVMHRAHDAPDGACCRVGWIQMDPSAVDANMESYRANVVPQIEAFDGFCSLSMLVDRATGRACGTQTFASRADLEKSRDAAAQLRARSMETMGITFTDVAELDLVIHHLRIPELV
jgi:quinol monooxygenase YgiN